MNKQQTGVLSNLDASVQPAVQQTAEGIGFLVNGLRNTSRQIVNGDCSPATTQKLLTYTDAIGALFEPLMAFAGHSGNTQGGGSSGIGGTASGATGTQPTTAGSRSTG